MQVTDYLPETETLHHGNLVNDISVLLYKLTVVTSGFHPFEASRAADKIIQARENLIRFVKYGERFGQKQYDELYESLQELRYVAMDDEPYSVLFARALGHIGSEPDTKELVDAVVTMDKVAYGITMASVAFGLDSIRRKEGEYFHDFHTAELERIL